jgi:hypothetical protein
MRTELRLSMTAITTVGDIATVNASTGPNLRQSIGAMMSPARNECVTEASSG